VEVLRLRISLLPAQQVSQVVLPKGLPTAEEIGLIGKLVRQFLQDVESFAEGRLRLLRPAGAVE
jgi:hypothetical protein